MNKISIVLLVATALSACATAKPPVTDEGSVVEEDHGQHPVNLPEDLSVDEYVAYSDAGELSHTCVVTSPAEMLCRDHLSPDAPRTPSGVFVQDGIRVEAADTHVAKSDAGPPIEPIIGGPTYDHQVRITRNALWMDDQKLADLEKGEVPANLKRGGAAGLQIIPLFEAGKEIRQRAKAGSESTPTVIVVSDQVTRYGLLTEVLYTLGRAGLATGDLSETHLATVRAREHFSITCETAPPDAEHQLVCRPVASETRGAAGVHQVELVNVGRHHLVSPKVVHKLSNKLSDGLLGNFCDRDQIRRVVRSATHDVRFCWEKELQDDPELSGKIMIRFVIGLDGQVVESTSTSSTMNHEAVEGCIAEVVSQLEFDEPKGGLCVINYPFLFELK